MTLVDFSIYYDFDEITSDIVRRLGKDWMILIKIELFIYILNVKPLSHSTLHNLLESTLVDSYDINFFVKFSILNCTVLDSLSICILSDFLGNSEWTELS